MEIMNVFTAFGLSASAGLNAYIPLLVISLLAKFTNLITLKSPWDTLTSWWIIGLLIVLSAVEFFADKAPAINHINDAIQTFIRPAAGAIAFAASANVISDISPILSLGAGLLIAGGTHAAKSLAVRPAVTAATAGAGNTPVSILEDLVSTMLSIVSIVIPIIAACIFILVTSWIIFVMLRRHNRRAAI
jgi:hypothetical protein